MATRTTDRAVGHLMSPMAVIVLLLHVLTPAHGARPPEIVMDIRNGLYPSTLLLSP